MIDLNFKLVVGAAGAALVGLLVFLRFCGTLSLPPKPPPPPPSTIARASDILSASSATPAAWRAFIEKDAEQAGLAVPTPDTMARAFPRKLDDGAHELGIGDSVETAGLRLTVDKLRGDDNDALVLDIENLGQSEVAYQVVTRPSIGASACNRREILLHDAMVIGPRRRERRSECVYRDGMKLTIDRVETLEIGPLSAWYLSRLPPSAVTLDTRTIKGHKPVGRAAPCNVMMSQVIRGGLENGSIEWRDLVDFYARHRCDTYQFPQGYKAFKKDNERSLPVSADSGPEIPRP